MFVLFLRVYSSCREHQYFHFDAVVESDKILCLFEWIKTIFPLSSVPFSSPLSITHVFYCSDLVQFAYYRYLYAELRNHEYSCSYIAS